MVLVLFLTSLGLGMGGGLVVPGLIELEPRNDENEDRLEVQWWVGGTIHVFT